MTLQNYLITDIKSNALLQKVDSLIANLSKELSGFYSTFYIVNKYSKAIKDLTDAYSEAFNQKCYITSFKGNSLYKFINRNSKYRLHYTDASYCNAVKCEIALLLAKYKDIHECQIKLAFMNVLLNNFNYYVKSGLDDSYALEIDINIIKNHYNMIMNTELKDFPIIKENETIKDAVFNNSKRSPIKEEFVPTKPTKKEHLTDLFEDGMTQREKVKVIANYWNCTEKSAENYMKKFDLWVRVKNVANKEQDYKALYEDALKEIESLKLQLNITLGHTENSQLTLNPSININKSKLTL